MDTHTTQSGPSQPAQQREKIPLAISACLTGAPVRHDGGHKRNSFCMERLAEFVDFIPVCPEVGIGLSTPRPSIRLQHSEGEIIARSRDGADLTAALRAFGKQQAAQLGNIAGYIVAAKSPSCGMERVRVYHPSGMATRSGVGIFAETLMQQRPELPVEEDGRLNDPQLRENFVTRLFVYHAWLKLNDDGLSAAGLIDFHSRCKFLLMAHSPVVYRRLGGLLADLSSDLQAISSDYIRELMTTLKTPITRRNHTNVLQHLQGYIKDRLSSPERQALASNIDHYRSGRLPLLAPLTLIRHYLQVHPTPYIEQQFYLQPHPESLCLRYAL